MARRVRVQSRSLCHRVAMFVFVLVSAKRSITGLPNTFLLAYACCPSSRVACCPEGLRHALSLTTHSADRMDATCGYCQLSSPNSHSHRRSLIKSLRHPCALLSPAVSRPYFSLASFIGLNVTALPDATSHFVPLPRRRTVRLDSVAFAATSLTPGKWRWPAFPAATMACPCPTCTARSAPRQRCIP